MSRDLFNVPQNVIMDGIRDYSEQDQDDLLWLSSHIREDLKGSRRAACEMLGVDFGTIVRVFGGNCNGGFHGFMTTVRKVRAQANVPGKDFIETCVTKRIFGTLDIARDQAAVVHICGSSGRSKTFATRQWIRSTNPGRAVYVDSPAIGGANALLQELAKRAGICTGRKTAEIVQRLESSFDSRHVIVLDEAVRLIPQGRGHDVRSLEFLRRLHDVCGVGLAFVSTDVFRREMENGAISDFLEQLMGRIEDPLYIPAKVSLQEAADVARGFNPDAAPDLIRLAHKIGNQRGRIRLLFTLMRQAAELAQHRKEPVSAEHLKASQALREGQFRWPDAGPRPPPGHLAIPGASSSAVHLVHLPAPRLRPPGRPPAVSLHPGCRRVLPAPPFLVAPTGRRPENRHFDSGAHRSNSGAHRPTCSNVPWQCSWRTGRPLQPPVFAL